MSKAINDSNIDLNKFPASKVRQLTKKMESSKATAKHIKQVASNLKAAKINLMHYQYTQLPSSKFQRKQKKSFKFRQDTNKQQYYNEGKQWGPSVYKNYEAHTSPDRCKKCGDSQHINGFRCLASRHQCRNCQKYGHFSSLCYKKEALTRKGPWSKDNAKHTNFRLVQFICKIPYAASQKKVPVMMHSACNWNCNLCKLRPGSQHCNILLQI